MVLVVLGAIVAALLLFGAVVDVRARRRGGRIRDGYGMSRDVRDARRDVRAWEQGAVGQGGDDLSWMKRRGR
jgi:hypothetical protein